MYEAHRFNIQNSLQSVQIQPIFQLNTGHLTQRKYFQLLHDEQKISSNPEEKYRFLNDFGQIIVCHTESFKTLSLLNQGSVPAEINKPTHPRDNWYQKPAESKGPQTNLLIEILRAQEDYFVDLTIKCFLPWILKIVAQIVISTLYQLNSPHKKCNSLNMNNKKINNNSQLFPNEKHHDLTANARKSNPCLINKTQQLDVFKPCEPQIQNKQPISHGKIQNFAILSFLTKAQESGLEQIKQLTQARINQNANIIYSIIRTRDAAINNNRRDGKQGNQQLTHSCIELKPSLLNEEMQTSESSVAQYVEATQNNQKLQTLKPSFLEPGNQWWQQNFFKVQQYDMETDNQSEQQLSQTQKARRQLLQKMTKQIVDSSLICSLEHVGLLDSQKQKRSKKYTASKKGSSISQVVEFISLKCIKEISQECQYRGWVQSEQPEKKHTVLEACIFEDQSLDISRLSIYDIKMPHLERTKYFYRYHFKQAQNSKDFLKSQNLCNNNQKNRHYVPGPNRYSINAASQSELQKSQIKYFPADPQYTIQDYIRCTGLIQCIWYDRFGRTQMIGYATAFGISQRIIVTCAHSVFQKKRARACDKIYFIPFHGDTSYSTKDHVYQSQDQNFLRFQPLKAYERYGSKPLKKDYAVFIIKGSFNNKCYLQLCDEELTQKQPLRIWGFPSKSYTLNTPIFGTNFIRMDLAGQYQKTKKHILVHNMPTLGGHSGSPIVRLTDKNKKPSIKVVGIHTHKGSGGTNQGLLITTQLKGKIMKFCKQICQDHKINFFQLFPGQRKEASVQISDL